MIVYDSLCIFSQDAAYMNFAVQVFKWTAFTCQCRPSLEPRAMYAKRQSPSRNQSNTVRNESLKEDLCFGSYFRFVRRQSKSSCREFDFTTKDTHTPRPQYASGIKLYTGPSKNNFKLRTSLGSHEPNADELQLEHAAYQCPGCKIGARFGLA